MLKQLFHLLVFLQLLYIYIYSESYGLNSDIVCIKQHNTKYEDESTSLCGTAAFKTAHFRPILNMLSPVSYNCVGCLKTDTSKC